MPLTSLIDCDGDGDGAGANALCLAPPNVSNTLAGLGSEPNALVQGCALNLLICALPTYAGTSHGMPYVGTFVGGVPKPKRLPNTPVSAAFDEPKANDDLLSF